jgi:hypothetical protein
MRRTYVNVNDLNLHNGLLDVKVQKGEPGLSVVQQSYFLPEMASPESAVSREAERDGRSVGCRILYMGRMSKAPIGQAFKAAFSEKGHSCKRLGSYLFFDTAVSGPMNDRDKFSLKLSWWLPDVATNQTFKGGLLQCCHPHQ